MTDHLALGSWVWVKDTKAEWAKAKVSKHEHKHVLVSHNSPPSETKRVNMPLIFAGGKS
jgi:hypothetical protein